MKFTRKVVCLLCCLSLCCTSLIVNAATNVDITKKTYCEDVLSQMSHGFNLQPMNVGDTINISNSFLLYNFIEEPIAIFYKIDPIGYAIYDYKNGIVLQYSTEYNHQFYVDKNEHYYYEGILEYYTKTGDGFLNLVTGMVKDVDIHNYSFTANDLYAHGNVVKESNIDAYSASEGPVYLLKNTRLYNCNVRSNFPVFYPNKTADELNKCPGVCGSVAAAIMLECYDDYYTLPAGYSFVDSNVKASNPYYPDIYGLELVKQLIPYIEPDANGSFFLNPGISSYLSDRNINGVASAGLLTVYQQTKDAIGADGAGWPVIVGTTKHYCVAIGYQNVTQKQIYVNNGYGSKEWYNANTIVSTWTMHINGTK